jgi:hypothetical protein
MPTTYNLNVENVQTSRRSKLFNDATSKVHDAMVVQSIMAGATSLDAIEAKINEASGYVTKDPLRKSILWHLRKLTKDGIVITAVSNGDAAPEVKAPVEPAVVKSKRQLKREAKAAAHAAYVGEEQVSAQ